jgi:hypothetical protein
MSATRSSVPVQKTLAGRSIVVHDYSTYVNHGCGCDECRAGMAEWQASARGRRNAAMLSGEVTPEHGTESTYTNYSCHCDPCTAAHRVQKASYRARQKEANRR